MEYAKRIILNEAAAGLLIGGIGTATYLTNGITAPVILMWLTSGIMICTFGVKFIRNNSTITKD